MRLVFYNSELANILNGCKSVYDIVAFLENTPECNNVSLEISRNGELFQLSYAGDRRGIVYRCDNNAVVCANMVVTYCYDAQPKMNKNAYPAIIQNLTDGTLLRLYNYRNKWHLATNQCLDASRAFWNDNRSFADRFYDTLRRDGVRIDYSKLNKHATYFFVISPDDHIVYTGSVRVDRNGSFSYRAAGSGLSLQSAEAPHDNVGNTDFVPYVIARNEHELWKKMISIPEDSVGLSIHMKHYPYHQIIYENPFYVRRKQKEYLDSLDEYGRFCRSVWSDEADDNVLRHTAELLFSYMTQYYVEKDTQSKIPRDVYQTRMLPKLWKAIGNNTEEGDTIGYKFVMKMLRDMAKRNAKSCERVYHIHKICSRYPSLCGTKDDTSYHDTNLDMRTDVMKIDNIETWCGDCAKQKPCVHDDIENENVDDDATQDENAE